MTKYNRFNFSPLTDDALAARMIRAAVEAQLAFPSNDPTPDYKVRTPETDAEWHAWRDRNPRYTSWQARQHDAEDSMALRLGVPFLSATAGDWLDR